MGTRCLWGVGLMVVLAWPLGGCGNLVQITGGEDAGTTSGGSAGTAGSGADGGGGAGGSACGADCSQIVTDQCHQAICNEDSGQCAVVDIANGTGCEDGQFCTIGEVCIDGTCGNGQPNDCGLAAPQCNVVSCAEASQSCSVAAAPDSSACAPSDLCQVNNSCQGGLCVGIPKDCSYAPVPGPCYVSECAPQNGECESHPGNEGAVCVDPNDLCTVDQTCSNGVCGGGQPKDCSLLSEGCLEGVCATQSGDCVQVPVSPGDPCAKPPDDCNTGVCNTQGICEPLPTNEGGPCEDGDPCTSGETCTQGQCSGGQPVPQTVYFAEDFADNSAGWTLGTEWEIGPAQASSGGTGNGDPSTDHTPTADNGIAGVVIGGTAATSVHDFYYLTSPVVDLSGVAGPVWLEFYRWLNSDYTPYMQNHVQVYDGSIWVTLWESGGPPAIFDDQWNKLVLEVTPHKNANLRVRIGFNIDSSGVYTVSSWNVDDLAFVDVSCN